VSVLCTFSVNVVLVKNGQVKIVDTCTLHNTHSATMTFRTQIKYYNVANGLKNEDMKMLDSN